MNPPTNPHKLGLGVGSCQYCGLTTPWRYRGIYVCRTHMVDVERDDPARIGATPRSAVVAPSTGFVKMGTFLRQSSIPGTRVDQDATPVRRAAPSVVGAIDEETARELASAVPRRAVPFDDPDPLRLEGFNPETKAYETASGVYEGMPEQQAPDPFHDDTIDPSQF